MCQSRVKVCVFAERKKGPDLYWRPVDLMG
jgi:hypothetical protein